ncbi:SgcJ/EcaC family oxidoreductase [Massilia forsythiae]|nr:SgcJ/EcaC family oxidoreductase [Massilia forsythiae]
MKRVLIIAAMLAAAATATVQARDLPKVYGEEATVPANGAEKEIAALFDHWEAALETGKPEEMVKLYARDGVLQPTVSNRVRTTPADIQDYFVHFMALKPHGHINYRQIRLLGPDTALDSGVYTFDIVRDGKPAKVQARYTYVYEKIGGEWKIMNHHSSAMPEQVVVEKVVAEKVAAN